MELNNPMFHTQTRKAFGMLFLTRSACNFSQRSIEGIEMEGEKKTLLRELQKLFVWNQCD